VPAEPEPEAVPQPGVGPEPLRQVLPTSADPSLTLPSPLTIPASSLGAENAGSPSLITGMPWADPSPAPVAAPPQTPADPGTWQPPAPAPSGPVPAAPTPPPAAALPVTPAPPSQVEDMTVNRSALSAGNSAVLVVAARCPHGHLSPAYAGVCRVCQTPMPQQQPTEIPRPSLGQLRLSTGGVVPLDRPVIMGRNPHIPPSYHGEQPNLVKLVDPGKDVSGQHLEVSLDYWNVVVRDLGSTNGTEVVLPGEMPVTLRGDDPVIIEPGTRVVLAGVLSFVFEVTG
jgi:hypothetical protein